MSDSFKKNGHSSPNSSDEFQYITDKGSAFSTGSKGLDPQKILGVLLKYKWIIGFFLVGGVAAAWFYANTVTPVYESRGTLLISSGNQSPANELSQIISQTTGYGTSSTLINELQVLQSKKFSRKVARNFIEEIANKQQYPLLWHQSETGELQQNSVKAVAREVRSNIDFYRAVEDADAIKVSYNSTSPQEAAKVVNLSMQTYVNSSTQQSRQAAGSTAEFLKQEKEKYKQKLRAAEQRLRQYMNVSEMVQISEQASVMVTNRANVELDLKRVNLELKAVQDNIAYYKNQLEKIIPSLTKQFSQASGARIKNLQTLLARHEQERSLIIAKNPGVRERDPVPARLIYLDEQIDRIKGEIRALSNKFFTSNNKFTGINSEDRAQMVSTIQAQLVELKMQRNQLESQQKALSIYKNEVDAEFNSLPTGMVKLAKLKRNVRINEELYLAVARQYADIAVLQQSQHGFGRIIDPAIISGTPVSPNKKLFLILGFMLGGVLACGFIGFKEFRDNSINNIEQLRTSLLPPLTVVPEIENVSRTNKKSFKTGKGTIPKEIVMLQNRTSITSEAIKFLKNNIVYQNGEHPPKSIAITSPEKGDGKSTIAANLAIALAEEGYWTLLVGADFRRPKLHKYFGLPHEAGLYNYLNGEISFQNVLKDTDIDMLKVITAGMDVEMPDIVSNSKTFRSLLEKMEEVFDAIIIDTPPYGVVSDSAGLLRYAEATVVVAKYRKTNRGMLVRTMEELKKISANVTSIVLNDFDHRKEVGNYYGDGYYQSLYSNYEEYSKIP